MIRNATNILSKIVRPAAFSTYRIQGNQPFRSQTEDYNTSSKKYLKEDAEKAYSQFLKENPIKQKQKTAIELDNSEQKPNSSFEFSFDPYRTLGLKVGASKQQIDSAYRNLASKYHPKVDSSFESAERFVQVSRAYEMLRPMKKQGKKSSSNGNSYMNQFNHHVKDFFGLSSGVGSSTKNKGKSNEIIAELYSETKNIKKIGDKKKVTIEREFNNNGRLVKITQIEDHHDNGQVHVHETFEDGNEIKNSKYKKQ